MGEGADKPFYQGDPGSITASITVSIKSSNTDSIHSRPEPSSAMASPARNNIRTFELAGPVGRLEALLNEGNADAQFATILCHPHPLGGGTMHNKVVYHAAKVFSSLGWPVLRFNFRGTGLSEGEHDGRAEVDDVKAGLDWIAKEYRLPIVAAGFSFGSVMGLQACCHSVAAGTHDIRGFAALGLPTSAKGRNYEFPFLADCRFPKFFLSGGNDQYAPEYQLRSTVAGAADPRELVIIAGADHFFLNQIEPMQQALLNWLVRTFVTAGTKETSAG